jgi:hypothetical protein
MNDVLRMTPWLAVLVWVLTAMLLRYGWFYLASDDSYIYLGYVKQAITAPHELFSYNPGEHSAGTTGILYYYILIGICWPTRLLTSSLAIEYSLTLGMYVLNAVLFVAIAHQYLRCWTALVPRDTSMSAAKIAVLFLLVCAQPQFLWGVFSGMENPLTAWLALLLFAELLRASAAWRSACIAALLSATRPELSCVLIFVPLVAALAHHRATTRQQRVPVKTGGPAPVRSPGALPSQVLLAYGAGVLCLAALVVPCYLTTGRLFPSALGTRIELAPLSTIGGWTARVAAVFQLRDYWATPWLLLTFLLIAAGMFLALIARRWAVMLLSLSLLAFFFLRAMFGVVEFNVEARYVSYLWPLYALGFAACGDKLWVWCENRRIFGGWFADSIVAIVAVVIAIVWPLRHFDALFSSDVTAMNAAHVEPARWMRDHLPAHSRVCIEPAGAIRVITDFYLIDAVGLTTAHGLSFRGNYIDFLDKERAEYVYDRAAHIDEIVTSDVGQALMTWARGRPFGDISVWRVNPIHGVTITRIAASSSGVNGSRPESVFDNSYVDRQYVGTGGGHWFAGGRMPAQIEAEFDRPIRVSGFGLIWWGKRIAPGGSVAIEYRLEGKRGSSWIPLVTKDADTKEVPDGRELRLIAIEEPLEIQGIRFVCTRTTQRLAPVLNEILALQDDGRPYVWLWSPAIGRVADGAN